MCLAWLLVAFAFVVGEVASIAMLGSYLGSVYTLGVLILAFGLGALLLGGRAALTLREALGAYSRGDEIGPVLASGALVAVAGILLIVPGLVSDVLAIALLVPAVRRPAARALTQRVKLRARRMRASVVMVGGRGAPGVIDVEGAEHVDPEEPWAERRPGEPPPSLP